jgi:hypothetical protein
MFCWPARTGATDLLSRLAFASSDGNDTRSSRRCSATSRASRAIASFQRDQGLPGMDEVTIGDQNFPDDAALEVLNGLSTRLGFNGADGNRSALERREGRPGPETEDKAADQQVSGPGERAKPVAQRRRRLLLPNHALPVFKAATCNARETAPPLDEIANALGADHRNIGCGKAPALPRHYGSCCCGASSREPTDGRARYLS